MIDINLEIRNPWSNRFKSLYSRVYHTVIEYKFLEFQIYRDSSIISFNFSLTTKQDHAGVTARFGLVGYCFDVNFYDSRHWDYTNKQYYTYDKKRKIK